MERVKGIIGAVIGDIAGSSREFRGVPSMRFKLMDSRSTFTDDTVLTMAVAEWMENRDNVNLEEALLRWGREYPNAGYGRGFKAFLRSGTRNPVGSTHNGSAMRVSPVGYLAESLEQALELARESALPSHDTHGAIAGAQATAAAIYMARTGSSKEDIRAFVESRFGFDLSSSYEEIRERQMDRLARRRAGDRQAHEELLASDITAMNSVIVFLSSDSYEETIRKAIYLGGDTDTQACIAGGIAAAFWGVPEDMVRQYLVTLPPDMIGLINAVDGTSWQPTGIIPPNTSRWRVDDIVVYGTDRNQTTGEGGFHRTRPKSMFLRHPNTGHPVVTIGATLEEVADQVRALLQEARENPSKRYLVHELGVRKGGFTTDQIAPLLREALAMPNILLPASFKAVLEGKPA